MLVPLNSFEDTELKTTLSFVLIFISLFSEVMFIFFPPALFKSDLE